MDELLIASVRLPPNRGGRTPRNDHVLFDEDLGFAALSEGLAPPPRGSLAARLVLDSLHQGARRFKMQWRRAGARPITDRPMAKLDAFAVLLEETNVRLLDTAHLAPWRLGTAASALCGLFDGHQLLLGHAGTCCAYLLREGKAQRLTEDHTLQRHLLALGQFRRAGMGGHSTTDEVCRAFGLVAGLEPDILTLDLLPGDRLVMLSSTASSVIGRTEVQQLSSWAELDEVEGHLRRLFEVQRPNPLTSYSALAIEVPSDVRPRATDWLALLAPLRDSELLRDMTETELLRVRKVLFEERYAPGDYVFHEGDAADRLYMIVRGRVAVEVAGRVLTELGEGQHFGGMGVAQGGTRSASIRAVTAVHLLSIDSEDFQRFLHSDGALGRKLLWALVRSVGGRVRALSG